MQSQQPSTPSTATSSVWQTVNKWTFKVYSAWVFFSLVGTGAAASPRNNFHATLCKSQKFKTANKPDVKLSSVDSTMTPESCLKLGIASDACQADLLMFKEFKADKTNWFKQRDIVDQASKKWVAEYTAKMQVVSQQLRGEELSIMNAIADELSLLVKYHHVAEAAMQQQIGACGEYKAVAIFDIIKRDLEKGTHTKIQSVVVKSNSKKNLIEDHGYLVLNGDLEDVNIQSNPEAFKAYFAKAKTGKVCDPWNRLYDDIDNVGDFYKGAKTWESVKVNTVNALALVREHYARLPGVAQSLITEIFDYMNIAIERVISPGSQNQKMEL